MTDSNYSIESFTTEKSAIHDFLQLYQELYAPEERMENTEEVKKLLLGRHPLNHGNQLYKYLVYHDKKVVGRCVCTFYPEDTSLYLGFFEVINEPQAAALIFTQAKQLARKLHCTQIVGPVNVSFWFGYRLKISHFQERPYTDEPYNKDYYQHFFAANGFEVSDHYVSNRYGVVPKDYIPAKLKRRWQLFQQQGYVVRSPKREEYAQAMDEVYELIMELYQSFPVFKPLSRPDFQVLFANYKYILKLKMVQLVYYQGKAVAFLINVPNYQNHVYQPLTPSNLLSVLKHKYFPEEYILLYMGVKKEHSGLGSALAYQVLRSLQKSQLPSIGALVHDGKATQFYAKDLIREQYEYVLLKYEL